MTEFEVETLKNEAAANIIAMSDSLASYIAIYLTLISGYLVVAFLAGGKLSRLQVSITTGLYTLAYLFQSLILLAYFRSISRAVKAFLAIAPSSQIGLIGQLGGGYLGLGIVILVYVASVWFMWNVRHSKNS